MLPRNLHPLVFKSGKIPLIAIGQIIEHFKGDWVECPALTGCASQGGTKEGKFGKVRDVLV